MTPYALTFVIAAILAFGLTPLTRWRTNRRRFLRRRTRPLTPLLDKPRVGGLIIFAAFCIAPFLAARLSSDVAELVDPKWRAIAGLCGAAFLVFLIGYLDDLSEMVWYCLLYTSDAADE